MTGLKQYLKERHERSILHTPQALHGVEVQISAVGRFKAPQLNFLINQIEKMITGASLKHLKFIKIGDFDALQKEDYKSYYFAIKSIKIYPFVYKNLFNFYFNFSNFELHFEAF